MIDREWLDAAGRRLREDFQKTFKVGPADRTAPDHTAWKIQAPAAGTRTPLVVTFSEPMDHALALRLIRVAAPNGETVEGLRTLSDQDRQWTFTPASAWPTGTYQLVIATTIEDVAGNNLGKVFDVDLFDSVQPNLTNETVKLPFIVR